MSAQEAAGWAGVVLWTALCVCGAWLLLALTLLAVSHLLRAAYDTVNGHRSSSYRRS